MKKSTIFLLLIIIVAGLLRLWKLNQVPVSMSDDEIRLVYSAYSIWETGRDLNGISFPLSFIVNYYAFNPSPIYLSSLFVGLFGLNMFTARLPFALAGIGSVFLVYLITYQLLKNRSIALLSSFAMTISAWHLQISRFAYEGGIALFFFLLGIHIFLKVGKNKLIYLVIAMFIFLLAFSSYSGTKLILLPIITILVWYKRKDLSFKQVRVVIICALFIFGSFWYLGKTQNAAQYGKNIFFFQNIEETEKAVELERRASQSPGFLEKIYNNKLTYWSKIFIDRYLYAFSPQYLFLSQEGSGIFAMWSRGQMYQIELVFLILGGLYLLKRWKKQLVLLTLFLIVGPIPAGLGSEPITYTLRSSFMLPWLMIFVGAGIYSLYEYIKNKKIRLILYSVIIVLYLYFFIGYLNQYYFNWVNTGARHYSKGAKDLVSFINGKKKNRDLVIVDGANYTFLLHYSFYNKINPDITRKNYSQNPIKIENILLIDSCYKMKAISSKDKIPKNSIYILSRECPGILRDYEYLMKPDHKIQSFDGTDEWLVFYSEK